MSHGMEALQRLVAQVRLLPNPEIEWANEIRLILTALLLGSIILLLQQYLFATHTFRRIASWTGNHLRIPRASSHLRAGPIYARRRGSNGNMRRTEFTDDSVAIYGWPTRGGVIILGHATHVDLTFLGLDVLNPPITRNRDSDVPAASSEEDSFCQRLLLLGAKWWDSVARSSFVNEVDAGLQPAIENVEAGRVPEPTLRERRWIRVGWENHAAAAAAAGSCGLWLLDCDSNMHGVLEEENMVPEDAGRIGLARSMRERCKILKRLGARRFGSLAEYEGKSTFLRAWEWKFDGEVGELVNYSGRTV